MAKKYREAKYLGPYYKCEECGGQCHCQYNVPRPKWKNTGPKNKWVCDECLIKLQLKDPATYAEFDKY